MGNFLVYQSTQIPVTGGAYLPPNYNLYVFLTKAIKFVSISFKVVLIALVAYLVYSLLSLAYSKYLDIVKTINDTNKKVSKITEYIESMALCNQKQEIAKLQLDSPTKNEEDNVFIVDESGVVVDKKKTEE